MSKKQSIISKNTTKRYGESSSLSPLTYESLFSTRLPAEAILSPDGRYIAFELWTRSPEEAKPHSRIWLVETNGSEPSPFTKGEHDDSDPRWSPDGKQLAYISIEGEKKEANRPQLFIREIDGAQPKRVCKMPNGISNPAWSPDGSRIAFISLEGKEPQKDPIVLTPERARRLWTVHLESDTPAPITPEGVSVWEYSWSPDGKSIAIYYSAGSGAGDTDWYRGQVGIVPAQGGAIQQLTRLSQQASSLAWSPDGSKIAYITGKWSDPSQGGGDIYVVSIENGETRNLTPGIDSSPGWCRWFPDGQSLLYAGWHGVTFQIGTVQVNNGSITLLDKDFVIGLGQAQLSPTPDMQRFAVIHSTARQPNDIWLGEIVASEQRAHHIKWQRISRLNPLIEETLALSSSKRVRYKSVDGWHIDGIFLPPLSHADDDPPPLYVDVHGGPSWAYMDGWDGFSQLLAAAGYAIFKPNMRGSWGHGVDFANAVLGDMGGKDFQDILHGIDYLIKQKLVDGERVAIGGWSNGGFLSAWAVTQTNRFKAAMVGAGITDWHNMHAQTNIADADVLLLNADPLENPEVYRARSPITYANRIATPTLILHGENDQAVPVAQAYAFYRALHERNVPVECVIYPREGHGLREREHVRDSLERLIRWLDRYL